MRSAKHIVLSTPSWCWSALSCEDRIGRWSGGPRWLWQTGAFGAPAIRISDCRFARFWAIRCSHGRAGTEPGESGGQSPVKPGKKLVMMCQEIWQRRAKETGNEVPGDAGAGRWRNRKTTRKKDWRTRCARTCTAARRSHAPEARRVRHRRAARASARAMTKD